MNVELISPNEIPPGGYRWRHSVTGKEFKAFETAEKCRRAVNAFLTANDYDPIAIEDVERYTYQWLIDHGFDHLLRVTQKESRSFSQWFQGMRGFGTIVQMELLGRPVRVSPERARTRAGICVTCPYNQPSFGNRTSDQVMIELARLTEIPEGLGVCEICSCPLKAKVHFTAAILRTGEEDPDLYPEHCWINHELK